MDSQSRVIDALVRDLRQVSLVAQQKSKAHLKVWSAIECGSFSSLISTAKKCSDQFGPQKYRLYVESPSFA